MKFFILLIGFLFSFVNTSLSQSNQADSIDSDLFSVFYILEELRLPGASKQYEMEGVPNYLEVKRSEALIHYRIRNYAFYHYGELEGLEINENKITSFYIRGRNPASLVLNSVELYHNDENELIVHYYRKLGGFDYLIKAHEASESEILEIKNYWKTH